MSIAEIVRICVTTAITGIAGVMIMLGAAMVFCLVGSLVRKYYWEWRNYVTVGKNVRGSDSKNQEDD